MPRTGVLCFLRYLFILHPTQEGEGQWDNRDIK